MNLHAKDNSHEKPPSDFSISTTATDADGAEFQHLGHASLTQQLPGSLDHRRLPHNLSIEHSTSTRVKFGSLEFTPRLYADARNEIAHHPATQVVFRFGRPTVARELLRSLIADESSVLLSSWGKLLNGNKEVSNEIRIVFFHNSNNKLRNAEFARGPIKTSQEDDFISSGHRFADDLDASIVCSALVSRARSCGLDLSDISSSWKINQTEMFNQLHPLERDLLTKLRDGILRCSSGGLYLGGGGLLRACSYGGARDSHSWALGEENR